MTELLQKAFSALDNLPDEEQDLLAAWILEEVAESDRRWEELFAKSNDKLRQMAAQAREDFRQGRTEPLDLNKLNGADRDSPYDHQTNQSGVQFS